MRSAAAEGLPQSFAGGDGGGRAGAAGAAPAAAAAAAAAPAPTDPRVTGPHGRPQEAPVWGKYMRTAQWVLALVALSLAAAEDGGSSLAPFRYLLAVTVMTLVFILAVGVLEWLNRLRHLALTINIVFDSVWILICATAAISSAAALGLRRELRLHCLDDNDCAKLKAATSLVFGLALLSGLSLLYEVLLWRAGHSGLDPTSRIALALDIMRVRKKSAVQIVQPVTTVGRKASGGEALSPAELGTGGGGGGGRLAAAATALRSALGRKGTAPSPAGPAAEATAPSPSGYAGGAGGAAAAAAAPPPTQPPWMAALDEVDLPGMYGNGGALAQAGRLTSTLRVREAAWLAKSFLAVRAAQLGLAVGVIAALTSLPGYSHTPAYGFLVATEALGLAAAALLGGWQAARALAGRAGAGAGASASTCRRFAAAGTQAYLIACALSDLLLWALIACAATAAAAVSTLPCARVTTSHGAAVYGVVHPGCSSHDRAAAALGLLSAPVWMAAAALSLATAHEGFRTLALLRRQQSQRREAAVLMNTTSASTIGGGGDGRGGQRASSGGGGGGYAGSSGESSGGEYGATAGGGGERLGPVSDTGLGHVRYGTVPPSWPGQAKRSGGGAATAAAAAAAPPPPTARGVSESAEERWTGIRVPHVSNSTPVLVRGGGRGGGADGGGADVEWGDDGLEVRQERGELHHPRSAAVFTIE
ncbi:hypothetical protein PLESTB_001049100 [Pleodorina starrii]|uniref:Uncharacterized protein n=1 Tax=Pleodorina starrii TaxID=330485 RepID=A0A9W6BPS2_9CHLO|nr:hypothetical protein PLESTB_001049100 [Pleodorina starrii]